MFNLIFFDYINNMNKTNKLTTFIFIIFFFLLLTISLVLMYHSQYISSLYTNHFEKQIMWIIIGLLVFIICYFIPKNIFLDIV